MKMLGWHLRVDGKACRYGCCYWRYSARKRTTGMERMRDKMTWRKEVRSV